MADAIPIRDPGDRRLDDYRCLSVPRERRRMEAPDPERGLPGFFVAEGITVVSRLLRSRHQVRSVVADPVRFERLRPLLGDVPAYVVPNEVLCDAAGFEVHRGVLAAADRWPLPHWREAVRGARRVVVLEGINDHENLGVLFRNAAGLGADAVLLSPQCCDPLYRRSVRVSMGHVMTVPWTRLEPWPAALADLAATGFRLAALTPAGEPIEAWAPEPGRPLALLVGAEGPGLSDTVMAAAHCGLAIRMHREVDSLNVASALAVALWALRPSDDATHIGSRGNQE